jgi:glycosyltransferase involved in cell wall biosynthesis
MRSIQVINVRWFNATAWYALFLGKLLKESGHAVLILALPHSPAYAKAREWGLEVRALPLNTNNPLRIINLFYSLKKIIRDFSPDVVNCHRGESFFLWPLLRSKKHPFALVRTRGDQRLPKNNPINKLLHKHLCQAVITTNSRMRDHFAAKFRLGKDKLHLIPGGVDRQKFKPSPRAGNKVREKFGFTRDNLVLGLVGRLDRVKGQKELVQAVARLYHQEGMRDLRLLLIGFSSAITEETARGWIKENNLQGICRISGPVESPAEYISALDIGIINSKWSETIARAALEIMACGVPLISSSVGVMPDLLSPEALFTPDDENALAEAIRRFRRKEDREEILKKQSRCISGLKEENFLNQTLDIYQKITSARDISR